MSGWQPQQNDPRQQPRYLPPWPPHGQQQPAPPPYNPDPALTGYMNQPQYAPPRPAAAPPKGRRKLNGRGIGCLAVLGVILIAVTWVAVSVATSHGGSFKASVQDYTVINPADLAVTVRVTNTGSSAATPTCTVKANDASYAYTGIDIGTLGNPVPVGQSNVYVDNVTITRQGAQYVTSVTVSCT